jgi:hypothetical protein
LALVEQVQLLALMVQVEVTAFLVQTHLVAVAVVRKAVLLVLRAVQAVAVHTQAT